MSENESGGSEVTGDILDVAKKVASAGDRWFLSFARSLGRVAGRVKQETDIVASSAKAAAATTGRVTSRMAKRMRPRFISVGLSNKPAESKTPNELLKVVAAHYGIDEDVLRSNRDALDTLELLHIMCTPKEESPVEVKAAPEPAAEPVFAPSPAFREEVAAPVPVIETRAVESDTIPWGTEASAQIAPARPEFMQASYLEPGFVVPDYARPAEPAPVLEPQDTQAEQPQDAQVVEPVAEQEAGAQDGQAESEELEPSSSEIPVYDPAEPDAATVDHGSKRGKKHRKGHR